MKKLTLAQLEAIAENWYRRTHKLRIIWQNEENEKEKRTKAFLLFIQMMHRTLKIGNIITKAKMPKAPKDILLGGISFGQLNGEYIVNNNQHGQKIKHLTKNRTF